MDIDELRKICLGFPGTGEDVKWEQLCFLVAEKIFCMASLEPPHSVCLKVDKEEFEELSTRSGFGQAAYLAKGQWISINSLDRISKKEWKSFITKSYELIKSKLPKKSREQLDK